MRTWQIVLCLAATCFESILASFSYANVSWTTMWNNKTLTVSPTITSASASIMVVYNSTLYHWGCAAGTTLYKVDLNDPTLTWSSKSSVIPFSTCCQGQCYSQDPDSGRYVYQVFNNGLYRVDLLTETAAHISTVPQASNSEWPCVAATPGGDYVFVSGGRENQKTRIFGIHSGTWVVKGASPNKDGGSGRYVHSCLHDQDLNFYVYGGITRPLPLENDDNTMYKRDIVTDVWTYVNTFSLRWGASMLRWRGVWAIVSGYCRPSGPNVMYNNVQLFDYTTSQLVNPAEFGTVDEFPVEILNAYCHPGMHGDVLFVPTSTEVIYVSVNHWPTPSPTSSPSFTPSTTPSRRPSSSPSRSPSFPPSLDPSSLPSHSPSRTPSSSPSLTPTSSGPTSTPVHAPSSNPSQSPSLYPSHSPSATPTLSPSESPSSHPTQEPSETQPNGGIPLPTRFPSLSPVSDQDTQPPTKSPTHHDERVSVSSSPTGIATPFLILGVVSSAALISFCVSKCFTDGGPQQSSVIILVWFAAVFDVWSDVAFLYQLYVFSFDDMFFLILFVFSSVVFLVSFASSFVQLSRFISQAAQNKQFRDWLEVNRTVVSFLALVSLSNLNAIRIINSRAFPLDIFAAPLTKKESIHLEMVGFWSMAIEDIPQFISQIAATARLGAITPVTVMSGLATITQIIVSSLKFVLNRVLFQTITSPSGNRQVDPEEIMPFTPRGQAAQAKHKQDFDVSESLPQVEE